MVNGTNGDPPPPPVVVTVTGGVGGTGGGLVRTPYGQADIFVKVVSPTKTVLVRCLRVFLQSLLGLLTAGPATGLIPAKDFAHLLIASASLSLSATVFCLIQNLIELLGNYDQSHPTFTK